MDAKRFRQLIKIISTVAIAYSSSVFAVDLGELQIASKQNNPLIARIELHNPENYNLSNFKARIASADEYSRIGLDRPKEVNKLNVSVKRVDNKNYLEISSKKAITREKTNLLIDLYWGDGELLREYDLNFARAEEPAVIEVQPLTAPIELSKPNNNSEQPQAINVAAGDNLWKIVHGYHKTYKVSMQQIMMAVYRANPEAFYNNNINNLKKGARLVIPSREQIIKVAHNDATQQVALHNNDWKNSSGVQGSAFIAKQESKEITKTATKPAAKLAVVAKSKPQEKIVEQPKLKVLVADSLTKQDLEKDKQALNDMLQKQSGHALLNSLSVATEATDTQLRANEELKDQISELKAQRESLSKLVQLKEIAITKYQALHQKDSGSAPVPVIKENLAQTAKVDEYNEQEHKKEIIEILSSVAVLAGGILVARRYRKKSENDFDDIENNPDEEVDGDIIESFMKNYDVNNIQEDDGIDYDDVDSRLKIAKTYVEIKDPDSARDMLKDIIETYGDKVGSTREFIDVKKIIENYDKK